MPPGGGAMLKTAAPCSASASPPWPLIALVVAQEGERLASDFMEISLAVWLLTAIMLLAGWAAGWACALRVRDRLALALVLVVRNVAIATAVAVTVLGRVKFAVFATAYFLNQIPLIAAALILSRLTRPPDAAPPR
jgi:ACR3 family arsenite efflux pump ArsB